MYRIRYQMIRKRALTMLPRARIRSPDKAEFQREYMNGPPLQLAARRFAECIINIVPWLFDMT